MSDTPRTDEKIKDIGCDIHWAIFARQLERENAELLARIEDYKDEFGPSKSIEIRELRAQLAAALADVSGRSEMLQIMQDKYEVERKAREEAEQEVITLRIYGTEATKIAGAAEARVRELKEKK